jgi:hypothetical protein
MDEAPQAVQSWARLPIFQEASRILKLPKEDRRRAIDKSPEALRQYVEAEIKRLWLYRSVS